MRIADTLLLRLRADILKGAKFQILYTVYNIESTLKGIYDFPLSNIGWDFFWRIYLLSILQMLQIQGIHLQKRNVIFVGIFMVPKSLL